MALPATRVRRAFLRSLLDSAQETGGTLLDALKCASKARVSAGSGGRVLVGHSSNGHQNEWEVQSDLTQVDAIEMVEDLRTRYDEARAYLIAEGTASPTDTQIFNEIMSHLVRRTSYAIDHYEARLEPSESSEESD
jgi:hypothetical protein